MIYRIKDIIAKPLEPVKSSSLGQAVNLVTKSINNGGISLVQGPPGTGKTTVFEQSFNEVFDQISSDIVILYIAPTNKLAADMLSRIAGAFKSRGKEKDITKEVRIYGSLFDYSQCEKMLDKVDKDVKIIISTEYQRPYFPTEKEVCLLIDEASKSPLHQPFITMTNQLLNVAGRGPLRCISVVGDPKQAISVRSEYRGSGRKLLLMENLMEGYLTSSGHDTSNQDITELARKYLRGNVYEFLDLTYRMPHPTEEAISSAYYGGSLRAAYDVSTRLKGLGEPNVASKLSAVNDKFRKTVEICQEGLSTQRGIIYVKVEQDYPFDDMSDMMLYEENRAEAGLYFATCLSAVTGKNCAVLTTYIDQCQQMKLLFQKNFVPKVKDIIPEIQRSVSFGTTHSWLGSEEDIVIAVLGKARAGGSSSTIYFNEPELLNVQLSRHRRILCVVGNLTALRNTAKKLNSMGRTLQFKEIADATETLIDQAGFEMRGRRAVRVKTGDCCVYYEWGQ